MEENKIINLALISIKNLKNNLNIIFKFKWKKIEIIIFQYKLKSIASPNPELAYEYVPLSVRAKKFLFQRVTNNTNIEETVSVDNLFEVEFLKIFFNFLRLPENIQPKRKRAWTYTFHIPGMALWRSKNSLRQQNRLWDVEKEVWFLNI